jgi:3-(3-hydroxy-phenyl)propionate hydroxylase
MFTAGGRCPIVSQFITSHRSSQVEKPAVRDREIMVVADDAPEPRAWLQATDAPAILVRPDRYVLGAARSLQELNALAAVV